MYEDQKPPKKKPGPKLHQAFIQRPDVKTSDILALRTQGMTYADIGRKFGLSPEAIRKRIKGALRHIDETLDVYQENKVKVFTATERRLIDALSEKKKIKNAPLSSLAYAFKEIYNANRLEQGLSTENVAINQIVAEKEKIRSEIEELEKQLKNLENDSEPDA